MTSQRAGTAEAAPAGDVNGQSPGQMLRQERARRGLSVAQVAEDLNLDRWIVEALEVDHFLVLGAPVYVRGHLRRYAVLLGLSADLVVGRYDALAGTPLPVPIVTSGVALRPTRSVRAVLFPVLLVLVVASVAAAAWWLLAAHDAPIAQDGAAVAVEPGPQPVGVLAAPLPAAVVPKDPTAAALQPAGTTAAAGGSARVSLRLEFSAPVWTEVYDAGGRRLLFEVGQPGHPRVLQADAPLQVSVGAAAAVSVRVNDQAIVIPRSAGKLEARFVVAADGSIR